MSNEKLFEVPFGKHKGKTLQTIYGEDEQYLRWLLGEFENKNSPFAKNLSIAINKTFNPDYEIIVPKELVLKNTATSQDCPF